MLELSMAIWADNEQVIRVVTDLWIKMVNFKVRLTVALLKGKGTELTLPLMQFSKQDPDSGRHTLMALDRPQEHAWARLACRCLRHANQLFFGQLSRPPSR